METQTLWERIKKFFMGSETIFWARLNVVIGALATVLTLVDPNLIAAVIDAKWVPVLFLGNGLAVEYLRRRRAPNLGEEK